MQWQKLWGTGGEAAHGTEVGWLAGRRWGAATQSLWSPAMERVAMETPRKPFGTAAKTLRHHWGPPAGCWGYWGGRQRAGDPESQAGEG